MKFLTEKCKICSNFYCRAFFPTFSLLFLYFFVHFLSKRTIKSYSKLPCSNQAPINPCKNSTLSTGNNVSSPSGSETRCVFSLRAYKSHEFTIFPAPEIEIGFMFENGLNGRFYQNKRLFFEFMIYLRECQILCVYFLFFL